MRKKDAKRSHRPVAETANPAHRTPTLFALLAAAALGGCVTTDHPATPPANGSPPPPSQPTMTRGLADVDSVRVLKLESFPVQAFAYVTGTLPDAATTIDRVSQERYGSTIEVTLGTARAADAMAATVMVPFEKRVPLDIAGLPAGTYRVVVNGVEASLSLTRDNMLP